MAEVPETTTARTSTTSSKSTSTYTPFTITSFPRIPLTTTFTPSAIECSQIHGNDILYYHDNPTLCMPSGFSSVRTAFFSPGIICPSGYWSACGGNQISTITTVTCCPIINGDMSMGCAAVSTLMGPWEFQFCTWNAVGHSGTTVDVVRTADGTTFTERKTITSKGGVNAYGVRMVYQSSDLPTTTPPATTQAASNSSGAGQSSSTPPTLAPSAGLSAGATAAIAVVVPLVVLAALVGLFIWRKRRRQDSGVLPQGSLSNGDNTAIQQKVYYGGPQELIGSWSRGGNAVVEMPGNHCIHELADDARPGAWQHKPPEWKGGPG